MNRVDLPDAADLDRQEATRTAADDRELARWRCKGSTWIQWPGPHKEWYALPGPMYFELGYIVSKYNKELSRLAEEGQGVLFGERRE